MSLAEASEELDRLESKLPESEAAQAMAEFLTKLAESQPELAASFFSRVTRIDDRRRLLEAITAAWAASAPGNLYDWAGENLAGSERLRACGTAALAVAETAQWDRAAGMLDALPYSTEKTSFTEQLAQKWAWEDPAAAFSWAFGMEDKSDRGRSLTAMADQLAAKEPALALRVLESSEEAAGVKTEITRALARAHSDAAITPGFVSSLSDSLQSAFHSEVVATLNKSDPARALDYAAGLEDSSMQTEGLRVVLQDVLQRSPSDAAAHFESFQGAETVRPALAGWLVDRWYSLDSQATSVWIGELPPGEVRDQAVLALVRNIGSADTGAAAAWAQTIQDEQVRKSAEELVTAFSSRPP